MGCLIVAVSCGRKKNNKNNGGEEDKGDNAGEGGDVHCEVKHFWEEDIQYKTECSESHKTECSTEYKTECSYHTETTYEEECTTQTVQEPVETCTTALQEVCTTATEASYKQECTTSYAKKCYHVRNKSVTIPLGRGSASSPPSPRMSRLVGRCQWSHRRRFASKCQNNIVIRCQPSLVLR